MHRLKLALIPLDNRAVTYAYANTLAKLAGIELLMPDRNLLGGLTDLAKVDEILNWLQSVINNVDHSIICLDTILYGGLINSRRHNFDYAYLILRLTNLMQLTKDKSFYAQSSIMRISDNYDNTEEKSYWQEYGRELFLWSKLLYEASNERLTQEDNTQLNELEKNIPSDIKQDYLTTRLTNHMINEQLIDYVASGQINTLVYGIDDCTNLGMNTLETKIIQDKFSKHKLNHKVFIYPGCDEIANLLMAKVIFDNLGIMRPSLNIKFALDSGQNIMGKYDGACFAEIFKQQLALFKNGESCTYPLNIVVHTAMQIQGDHIILDYKDKDNIVDTNLNVTATLNCLENTNCPIVLCDLAYANGADPMLVEALLNAPKLITKIVGFSAWNTAGNSIGSAISQAICYASGLQQSNQETFALAVKENLFIRIVDDYAWQSKARQLLKGKILTNHQDLLNNLLASDINIISHKLDYYPQHLNLSLPWQRSFEIEVSC